MRSPQGDGALVDRAAELACIRLDGPDGPPVMRLLLRSEPFDPRFVARAAEAARAPLDANPSPTEATKLRRVLENRIGHDGAAFVPR
ncbi:hypothetical protein ABT124_07800 [Streptomyces sp. NPDC001982]|uniref:hypothetical protein n=1 Tax=Streptomyces sp. NPDC001982 TaxID=3154405 RepID=UPI00332D747E